MHTYEVFVDIKECFEQNIDDRIMATRYEVDAKTLNMAHDAALHKAESDYPRASEYDIRITRVLR